MVKARKLKSGSWNIQAYSHQENGKPIYISITAQTKDECELKYAEFKKTKKIRPATKQTVRQVVESYIILSKEVLSPTTIWNYGKILNHAFPSIMDTPITRLTNDAMQKAINLECRRKCERKNSTISAKTVKNEWSLLSTALKSKGYTYCVRLPKTQHKNENLPEPSAIINLLKGTDIELPCLLAMWCSLRLSEVRGLTCKDIQGNNLYINQVMVRVSGKDIVKTLAKTDASIRTVQIPPYILTLINNTNSMQKYLKTGKNCPLIASKSYHITNVFYRIMKNAGFDISFHDLRHYYATISLGLGINPKLVQTSGGWSSEKIMMDIYNQSINSEQQKASLIRNRYFDNILNETMNAKGKVLEFSKFTAFYQAGSTPATGTKKDPQED